LAENSLPEDLLLQKLREPEMPSIDRSTLYYGHFSGNLAFKKDVADFLSERFKAQKPINPNNLAMAMGALATIDLLAYALANEGDCILLPAPHYPGFAAELYDRSRVKSYQVQLTSQLEENEIEPFSLTPRRLERTYQQARKEGETVRGLMLTNPDNPTGRVLDKDQLLQILQWAHSHSLHVIVNEIYGLTVHDPDTCFTSVFYLSDIPDPSRTHFIWSFSKDFCLSGFRCGVVHSWNDDVIQVINKVCYFGCVPHIVQSMMSGLIRDKVWLDETYFPNNVKGVRDAFLYTRNTLEALGVQVHPGKAGFFIWADFNKFMANKSYEEERKLFQKFLDAGVMLIPSERFFLNEPGWFRIIFTCNRKRLQLGLERISNVCRLASSK